MAAQGRRGARSGRGWYTPADGAAREDDPAMLVLLEAVRAETGHAPRRIGAGEIQRRLLAMLVVAGAGALAEGQLARPGDIDLVALHALGFPRWKGGPVHAADLWGLAPLAAELDPARADGPGLALLIERIESGRRLGDEEAPEGQEDRGGGGAGQQSGED